MLNPLKCFDFRLNPPTVQVYKIVSVGKSGIDGYYYKLLSKGVRELFD